MNTDKRYSVFISSTFEDLKVERRAVQDVILSAGDFPVQMESFPAADVDQFAFIKALIDKCDYYVLIVAGRYGTPTEDGVSYTEKEYRYAVAQNIPVLVMLHGDRGSIRDDKTEASDKGKEQLAKFIEEIESGRIRNTWTSHAELKLAVRESLDFAKLTKPAVGWVRGNTTANIDVLEELNKVRSENSKYRDAIGNLEIELALPPIPSADSPIEIDLIPTTLRSGYGGGEISGTYARIQSTWIDAFPVFFSNLKWNTSDWGGEEHYYSEHIDTCAALGAALASEVATFATEGLYCISKATFDRLSSYYIEVGLMIADGERPFTETGQRLARRHRIVGAGAESFSTIKGKVSKSFSSAASNLNDDEIPF